MMTGAEAYDAMLAHHRILGERLERRVASVSAAAAAGQPHGPAVTDLAGLMDREILPHAVAEEATIYRAAALAGMADIVSEMTAEHATLSEATRRLAGAVTAAEAARHAEQIGRLFERHVAKENDVLLPGLLASPGADLPALLADMHRRVERAAPRERPPSPAPGRPRAAQAGEQELDVRILPPARRHESIFAAYGALAPGTSFVLVSDHDPKPLRYQFEAEHAGRFTWDYLEAGPATWRVRIGRAAGPGPSPAGRPASPGAPG